ncbi:MAG: hypothetical protein AAGJ28_25245, partial [Pseudomonadota bacterium]
LGEFRAQRAINAARQEGDFFSIQEIQEYLDFDLGDGTQPSSAAPASELPMAPTRDVPQVEQTEQPQIRVLRIRGQ